MRLDVQQASSCPRLQELLDLALGDVAHRDWQQVQTAIQERSAEAEAPQAEVEPPAPLQAKDRRNVAGELEHSEAARAQYSAELRDIRLDRASVGDMLEDDARKDEIKAAVGEDTEVGGAVYEEGDALDVRRSAPARL